MNNHIRKILLALSLLGGIASYAQTVVVEEGVLYLIEDGRAIVGRQNKELSGNIVIPSEISYQGESFEVNALVKTTNDIWVADNTYWCEGGAFQETNVSSVTLPPTITSIPMGTFNSCPQLESVTIEGAIDRIPDGAFAGCGSLREMKIPESVITIGCFAFGDCTSLQSIKLPSSLTVIEDGAFKRSGLTSIDIPRSVQYIGEEAFDSAPLTLVTLRYMDLEDKDCALTAFVNIPECELMVREGSKSVFENEYPWSEFSVITGFDDGDETVIVSNKLNLTVDGIRYVIYHNTLTAEISRQKGQASGDVIIPSYIEYEGKQYEVTSIAQPTFMCCVADGSLHCQNAAFQDCQLTSITLPVGITTIPVGCFFNCQQLQSITLPENLKVIEAGAFAYCMNLESVDLPDSVTDLGSASYGYGYHSFVFGFCEKLKSLRIPEGVTTIAAGCFLYSGIEELEISGNVTNIENDAINAGSLRLLKMHVKDLGKLTYTERSFGDMSKCTLLVPQGCRQVYSEFYPWMDFLAIEEFDDGGEIYVPEILIAHIADIRYILDLEELVAMVARQDKDLAGDIVIPEEIKYEENTFRVTSLVEPTFVVAISGDEVDTEGGAFQQTAIHSITLPSTITRIPHGSFRQCADLTEVNLPETLEEIGGGAFSDCYSLEEIYIPESVKRLYAESGYGDISYVFGNCPLLKKVNIPDGIDRIPGGCFKYGGLNTFIITDNIKYLEPNSFDLSGLEYVKIAHKDLSELTYTESVFPKNISDVTLLVPEGSKEIYSQFYPWRDFKSIEEFREENDRHKYNAYRFWIEWLIEKIEDIIDETKPQRVVRYAELVDETERALQFLPSGKTLDELDPPLISGLKFVRWEEVPSHMPSGDTAVRAIYKEDFTTGISGVTLDPTEIIRIHTLGGIPVANRIPDLAAGIYVVTLCDGTVRKVFIE